MPSMLQQKLNWRTPLFSCLLPIVLVMIFLGVPVPMAPPSKHKPISEVSVLEENRKRRRLTAPTCHRTRFAFIKKQ